MSIPLRPVHTRGLVSGMWSRNNPLHEYVNHQYVVCCRDCRLTGSHKEDILICHLYFVTGTVCKSSAHNVTLKIEVILSLCSWCRNWNLLNLMQHDFCSCNKTFFWKNTCRLESCHCNMYPLHIPTTCHLVCTNLTRCRWMSAYVSGKYLVALLELLDHPRGTFIY